MTKLLVQGEVILAKDVVEQGDEIRSPDAIYPKHVIEGWQIIDVEVPDGFTCAGYTFDGVGVAEKAAPVPAPVVPQVVTMRQATQALILAGLDDDVEAMLAAMPGTEGKLARAEWAKSQVVERNRPLVIQMGAALGLSDADVDQLFITAAGLE